MTTTTGAGSGGHQCEGQVARGRGEGFGSRQCLRTSVVEEGGHWYCTNHAPSYLERRAANRAAETASATERRRYATEANESRRRLIAAVRQAATDPNALPVEVMHALNEYNAAASRSQSLGG